MHFIYKVTNLITNHYYIGAHSTKYINDGYLGSGFLIKRAIAFYGEENFNREILHFCKTRKELFVLERKIVNFKLIKDPDCYNLQTGGKRRSKNTRKVRVKSKSCVELYK